MKRCNPRRLTAVGRSLFASLVGCMCMIVCQGGALAGDGARWDVEEAREWYCEAGPIRGFNYLPRTAVNDVEMWEEATFDLKTIDQELGWAEKAGYNGLRVFLQYVVWKDDPEGMKSRIREFLSVADRHGFRTMFIMFDDCQFGDQGPVPGRQLDPVPGVHNGRWVPSPGHKLVGNQSAWPSLERYVTDIISSFGKDRRVQVWDLYNEPGNSGMNDQSLPLVELAFRWARNASPEQPLTVGVWRRMSEAMRRHVIEHSDIPSFHFYEQPSKLEVAIHDLLETGRPLLCTEWLRRQVENNFETMLPQFAAQGIGWYHWGLVAGRTQTYLWWGSKPGTPVPKVWQHDIFRPEGTPYDDAEIDLLQKAARQPWRWEGCRE